MTKSEFVDRVAHDSGLARALAQRAVDVMIDTIGETLSGGDRVELDGLGTFEIDEEHRPSFRGDDRLAARVRGRDI